MFFFPCYLTFKDYGFDYSYFLYLFSCFAVTLPLDLERESLDNSSNLNSGTPTAIDGSAYDTSNFIFFNYVHSLTLKYMLFLFFN